MKKLNCDEIKRIKKDVIKVYFSLIILAVLFGIGHLIYTFYRFWGK